MKILKISRVVERGNPRSDSWNPPLHPQGLALGECQILSKVMTVTSGGQNKRPGR
jgi:hypothetical protein